MGCLSYLLKNKNFKYIYSEEKNIFLMLLNYLNVLPGNKNIGVRKQFRTTVIKENKGNIKNVF